MSKVFERILIVMFENQYRSYVMQHPFMQKMAAAGCNMMNYFGCFHPSQTNYIASLSGELCGVTNDIPPYPPLSQQTLVDLLQPENEGLRVSWKAYMEGYPPQPWNPAWKNPDYPSSEQPVTEFPNNGKDLAYYFRKHNAFASFAGIQANPDRWKNIVDEGEFWNDVFNQQLPQYSWFTPDIWNDGHYLFNTHTDTDPRTLLVGQMAGWLEYVFFGNIDSTKVQRGSNYQQSTIGLNLDFDLLLKDPKKAYAQSHIPSGTLVVVTFDEADYDATGYDTNYDGPNQIYTVLLGDMIEPGMQIGTPHNHYGMIKTAQQNFGLGDLGKNDADANWLRFLWGESFSWSKPSPTNVTATGHIALAALGSQACLVYPDATGAKLMTSTFANGQWSPGQDTGLAYSGGPLAMAQLKDQLILVFTQNSGKDMCYATYDNKKGWSEASLLNQQTGGYFAITAYTDFADNTEKIMLAWQSADDEYIYALGYDTGGWGKEASPVGQLTDGPMAFEQLGPSLFLLYKERNSFRMRMTSYNTAPFNAFDAVNFQGDPAPENNTSLHQWSPMDFPVGHFAKKFAALQNDYTANSQLALATLGGEMHLVHRGQYSDTDNLYTETFGLTGILTASSTGTNGYGTLAQAGWTAEQELGALTMDPSGAIAMCRAGEQLILVYQGSGSNTLNYCTGQYRQ